MNAVLLDLLYHVVEDGCNRWRACCPVCCQNRRTLIIRVDPDDGSTWLRCASGCPPGAVLHALGLPWNTLYPRRRRRRKHAPRPEWWREESRYARDPGPVGER